MNHSREGRLLGPDADKDAEPFAQQVGRNTVASRPVAYLVAPERLPLSSFPIHGVVSVAMAVSSLPPVPARHQRPSTTTPHHPLRGGPRRREPVAFTPHPESAPERGHGRAREESAQERISPLGGAPRANVRRGRSHLPQLPGANEARRTAARPTGKARSSGDTPSGATQTTAEGTRRRKRRRNARGASPRRSLAQASVSRVLHLSQSAPHATIHPENGPRGRPGPAPRLPDALPNRPRIAYAPMNGFPCAAFVWKPLTEVEETPLVARLAGLGRRLGAAARLAPGAKSGSK